MKVFTLPFLGNLMLNAKDLSWRRCQQSPKGAFNCESQVSGALTLRHFLPMINAYDVVSYALAVLAVAFASVAAAFLPSNRASRINLVDTLRAE